MTIKRKITLITVLMVVVVIAAISYLGLSFRTATLENSRQLVLAEASTISSITSSELNEDFESVRTFAQALQGFEKLDSLTRETVYNQIGRNLMEKNPRFTAVWYNFQLFAIDEEWNKEYGRQRHTFFRAKDGIDLKDTILERGGEDPSSTYALIHKQNREFITEPYFYSYYGSEEILETSVCVPLQVNGRFAGLAGVDLAIDRYRSITDKIKPYEGSFAFLISSSGTIISHPDREMVGKKFQDKESHLWNTLDPGKAMKEGTQISMTAELGKEDFFFSVTPMILGDSNTNWALILAVAEKIILQKPTYYFISTLVIGLLGVGVVAFFIFMVFRGILKGLDQNMVFSSRMRDGYLDGKFDKVSNDEFGQLAQAQKEMLEKFRSIYNLILSTAQNLLGLSDQILNELNGIKEGTSVQAASLEEISSSVEEFSESIHGNYNSSLTTKEISDEAMKEIEHGHGATHEAFSAMQEIVDRVMEIKEIAGRTNLLALNASIEAARAGEMGKGFSVVAGEVRKLAENSNRLTKSVEDLSVKGMNISKEATHRLGNSVGEIEKTTHHVNSIVNACKAQSNGVEQINSSIQQLNEVAQGNLSASESINNKAESLRAEARRLREAISFFKMN